MLFLQHLNICFIYKKKLQFKRTFLIKNKEIYKISVRFYPGGKEFGHVAKIVKAINKTPNSNVNHNAVVVVTQRSNASSISNTTTSSKFIPVNNNTNKFDRNIEKESNKSSLTATDGFDSTRNKVSVNSFNTTEKLWNIVNGLILNITTRNTPVTIEELEKIIELINNLPPLLEYQTTFIKEFRKFLEAQKIILKEYPQTSEYFPINPVINNPEIDYLLKKAINNDPNYYIIYNDFFKLKLISICRTEEDFTNNVFCYEKALHLLQNYPNMPEEIFLVFLNQLNLSVYPDAIYTQDKILDTDNTSVIIKDAEGFKLDNKIYKIMSTCPQFKDFGEEFIMNPKQFKTCLENNPIIGGIIISDPVSTAITLSGPHLHVFIAIEESSNKDYLLGFAILTSTKDDNTILLSDTQLDLSKETNVNYQKLHPKRYENDEGIYFSKINSDKILSKTNKQQMIRFNTNFIRLPKKDFEELPKATNYLNIKDIRNKILEEIVPFAEVFCNTSCEKVLPLTKDNLVPFLHQYILNQIADIEKQRNDFLNKLDSLLEDDKNSKINEKQNQKKNQFNRKREIIYNASLPKEAQLLIKILNKLKIFDEKKVIMLKNLENQKNIEKYKKKS